MTRISKIFTAVIVLAATALMRPTSAQAVSIETVPIGNPGNAPDTEVMGIDGTTGYGSVDYMYRIGKYEVTNFQYVEFLNGVDPTGSNSLALYKNLMSSDARGGVILNGAAPNGSKYAVKLGRANNPVVFVNWYDSIRFANWLHNGQGGGSTENGAYTLLGGTPTPSNGDSITRNPGANWWLPSENEWYKAAFHKNDGVTGNYWDYPTSTNTPPYSDQPPGTSAPDPSNTANFYKNDFIANGYNDGYAVSGANVFPTDNALTDVGAYNLSTSSYGTLDQAGNVWEWNETLFPPVQNARGARGGAWDDVNFNDLQATTRGGFTPAFEAGGLGFRVATVVPEPGSMAVAVALLAAALRLRKSWTQPPRIWRSDCVKRLAPPLALAIACASLATADAATLRSIKHPRDIVYPKAISADGSTVVGQVGFSSSFGGPLPVRAFRWTQASGVVELGALDQAKLSSTATAVSADGSVIVGFGDSLTGHQAFRWTAAMGMEGLGTLPTEVAGVRASRAFGVSSDGATVMGVSGFVNIAGNFSSGSYFRWTEAQGMVPLGAGVGGPTTPAASVDAGALAWTSNGPVSQRWTAADGFLNLGSLPDGSVGTPRAMSADGSVIVGGTFGYSHFFRWTPSTGMVDLGDVGVASAVSADGSVVLGTLGQTEQGDAFYWTQHGGVRLLKDVLHDDYGLDLTGWWLQQATAVSADGRTIVGYGFTPDGGTAWIVNLAVPESTAVLLSASAAAALTHLPNCRRHKPLRRAAGA